MPTYEYRCESCGHEFELFQSMTDAVKRKCPICKKPALKRLFGIGAGIIFKGSGFYETDYRSDSYTKAAEAEKKAGTGGDSATSEKKETAKADASASSAQKAEAPSKSSSAKPAKSPAKKRSKR